MIFTLAAPSSIPAGRKRLACLPSAAFRRRRAVCVPRRMHVDLKLPNPIHSSRVGLRADLHSSRIPLPAGAEARPTFVSTIKLKGSASRGTKTAPLPALRSLQAKESHLSSVLCLLSSVFCHLSVVNDTMHVPHIIRRFNGVALFKKFNHRPMLRVVHLTHLATPVLFTEFKQPLAYDINLL